MKHLEERQIQRLVDGELDPQSCLWAETHLEQCELCRRAAQHIEMTSHVVKSTVPDLAGFRHGAEFWACLSQDLPRSRSRALPWLALLPPFLLGAFGTFASLIVQSVHTGLALQQIGLIRPMGSRMVSRLAGSMQTPMLEENLFRRLGMSGEEMSQNLMIVWEDVNRSTHSGAGALLALVFSGLAFAAVASLYMVWVICWVAPGERRIDSVRSRSGPQEGKGGN